MKPELREFLVTACRHLDVYFLAGFLGVTASSLVGALRPRQQRPVSEFSVSKLTRQLTKLRPELERMMQRPRQRYFTIGREGEMYERD